MAPRRRAGPTAGILKFLSVTPMLLWILVLVILPNLFLVLYSLWTNSLGTVESVWTLDNYRQLFGSDVFQLLFKRTLLIALVSSLFATTIAYCMAYVVVRYFGRYKVLAALLVLIPLWVSYQIGRASCRERV